MLEGVKCGIEECIYNDHKQHCTASSINILSNGNDIVGTTKGTRCATFEFERHTNHDGATVR